MPACFSPLQEAAAVPLTGCQKGRLWFWKGHQQDSCSLCGNPKDGNLDLVGGHVFFDSQRFHLLPSHAAPCKDKGFSSSERWSLQEEIKLPDTKSDSLEQRLYLCFSRLLNMWMEVLEQQLTGWLGSLHLYLATCRPVPTHSTPLPVSCRLWSQNHHPKDPWLEYPCPKAEIRKKVSLSKPNTATCVYQKDRSTGYAPNFHPTPKGKGAHLYFSLWN